MPATPRPPAFLRARHRWSLIGLFILNSAGLAPAAEAPVDLLAAIRRMDEPAWSASLQQKADLTARDAQGNTALHLAALNHDRRAVSALLAAGAAVDPRNQAEATPLVYGAGDPEIVRSLLARGADPNAASTLKNTPLIVAVAHPRSHDAVQLLIEAGARLDVRKTSPIHVVLPRAIIAGDRRTIDLLLARGMAQDPATAAAALSAAAIGGDLASIEDLLAAGANPNLEPNFSGHALNYALVGENAPAALRLIEAGADVHLRSPEATGTPPMVFAAYNQSGDARVARALLARGADLNAADHYGATALSYALRSGPDTPLVAFLRSQGAAATDASRSKPVPNRPVPDGAAARAALVRERLPATLRLLHDSSDAFLENAFVRRANCTSCHGQDLPEAVYGLARERGLAVNDASLGRQLAAKTSRWSERAEAARQMTAPLPGSPATIAYGLFGLHGSRYERDEMTDAMVRYLLRTQQPDGRWTDPIRRPPIEDGTFVGTAWVTLAVRDYPPRGHEPAAARAREKAARWLAQQKPATPNESVFQLLGLHWAGAERATIARAAKDVAAAQRDDGGWSQLPGLASDAWATGTALYALHETGLPATDVVYQRGVAFLLRTQFEDGSWWVRTRTWPFQPHFNARFPHGKDQWISQGATAWAAMALLFTLGPAEPALPAPTARDLIAATSRAAATSPAKAASAGNGTAPSRQVEFARDIRPLLERSCAGCHDGEKPRGGFVVTALDRLIKGGASGEPAIVPGHAEASPLFQYVRGIIEDLEMPPLNRREKYPELAADEIELLRSWIDGGAAEVPDSAGPRSSPAPGPPVPRVRQSL